MFHKVKLLPVEYKIIGVMLLTTFINMLATLN